MTVPDHQRRNVEATEVVLHDVKGIIAALDLSIEALPIGALKGPQGDAIYTMVRLLGQKLEEVDRKRSMEWAGLGGASEALAAEDVATARGEGRIEAA
ncbi:hypothetical protein LAZ40_13215 [Cereibacter sphaeroides]|uniref:hypothetical protein n=1 Tax=Cereibacter sphaeroides TaxID=1063 RepID=UPI001F27D646|nr:hypothetical protein [Cereibacter sphaeroides]MCE6959981.1 hypothetical protein [Cereibacter sphaeroides]MCE6973066.1 hypothetical protein [Cereibacter sphaeroides]